MGRLAGIRLYVHVTFFLLLAWVFAAEVARGRGWEAGFEAVALVACIFALVVIHELAHAVTAKRFGIRTRSITLLPIGGVSGIERIPDRPREEFLMAAAGPASNLVIAALLAAVIVAGGGTLAFTQLRLVGGPFVNKLMWANVSLAIFNLLPAYPMDGGRLVHALLRSQLKEPTATSVAAAVGQAMAAVFALVGLVANPLLVLIAVFVWIGARRESSMAQLHAALRGLKVSDAMIRNPAVLSPDEPLGRAVEILLRGFQHDFPVVRGGELVGVVTRPDLVRAMARGEGAATVAGIMERDVVVAEPTELLDTVLQRTGGSRAPILVASNGSLVGMVTLETVGELVLFRRLRPAV